MNKTAIIKKENEAGETMMTDDEVLSIYKTIVPFIAAMSGPSCEVVLHDIRNPEHSVIAIENGYQTKRKIGSPLTDFAMESIESKAYLENDFISNYSGSTKGKTFLSSTLYIKNNGRLIGMLCCNKDTSTVSDLENALKRVEYQYNLIVRSHEVHENLDEQRDTMVMEAVSQIIEKHGGSAMLKKAEKIQIVQELSNSGVLKMKGAVNEVARQLNVSIPTIYRYIHK